MQNDVHALLGGVRLPNIQLARLGFEEINRLADRCILEFHPGNNDGVELVLYGRCAAGCSRSDEHSAVARAVFANRLFPAFGDFPERAAPSLFIGLVSVFGALLVHLDLPLASRNVGRIDRQNLVVALHRLFILSGVVKALSLHK